MTSVRITENELKNRLTAKEMKKTIPEKIIAQRYLLDELSKSMFSRSHTPMGQGDPELNEQTKKYIQKYDNFPEMVTVVGCGGIGSWLAMFLAGIESVKRIVLVDPDKVGVTNIGRTPFMAHHISQPKVDCLSEMIAMKNPTISVTKVQNRFGAVTTIKNELTGSMETIPQIIEREHKKGRMFSSWSCRCTFYDAKNEEYAPVSIFDCRDNNNHSIYDVIASENMTTDKGNPILAFVIRVAYNGCSVTNDACSNERDVVGRNGYTQVNSSMIPSVYCAWTALDMLATEYHIRRYGSDKTRASVFKDDFMSSVPWTFNCSEERKYVAMGIMVEKLILANARGTELKNKEDNSLAKQLKSFFSNKTRLKEVFSKTADIIV